VSDAHADPARGAPRPIILIPAFNEATALPAVLAEIRAHCDYPVIVIDDASSDATRDLARAGGAEVLPLASQLGAWGATQAGIRYAYRHGYDPVITMDADGQHEAQYLDSLLTPVLAGSADVAIGACTARGSRLRKVAWVLMKRSSGISLEDVTSGFRAYNRAAVRVLAGAPASLCSYQDIGVLALLLSRGLRVVDLQVSMRERRDGGSRVFSSWLMVIYYMLHTLLLGFSKRPLRGYRAHAAGGRHV
jgi:glycosyltransferase involved in cell wall biosynthesis